MSSILPGNEPDEDENEPDEEEPDEDDNEPDEEEPDEDEGGAVTVVSTVAPVPAPASSTPTPVDPTTTTLVVPASTPAAATPSRSVVSAASATAVSADDSPAAASGNTPSGLTTYTTTNNEGPLTVTTTDAGDIDGTLSDLTTYATTNNQGDTVTITTTPVVLQRPSPSNGTNGDSSGLSEGETAGVAIGTITPILLIIGGLFWCFRRRFRRRSKQERSSISTLGGNTTDGRSSAGEKGPPGDVDLQSELLKNDGPAELYDTRKSPEAVEAGHGIPKNTRLAQIYTAYRLVHELSAPTPAEMEGEGTVAGWVPATAELEGERREMARDPATGEVVSPLSSAPSVTHRSPSGNAGTAGGTNTVWPLDSRTQTIPRKLVPGLRTSNG
ncbi:uncharacterized protein LTR77_006417 [Saxophila tyrrhenica]|uniref:Uncharacterized protein n=1 Tax=Saxophila tyrrhenica TaxID=1690608 RepID=A0AAV9P8B5_9PEZI|nr:hypothetical protein LTR77_006417 [Saxophila tyrrhenica]